MSHHYYTTSPQTAHDKKEWQFTLKGRRFTFVTDSGVFSRDRVDFGSQFLIENFSEENLPSGALLDVGCGYGPIGLALAAQSDRRVEMVDVNERALGLAQENGRRNQINNIKVYASESYRNVKEKNYAAIVSNPPIRAGKKVVHEILSGAYDHLALGGRLLIVIQKKQGAPSAKKKMLEVFGNVETLGTKKGYHLLTSIKK